MLNIDLNCDMGESTHLWSYNIDHDISLLPYFTSINIACGFHAGDPDTISKLIQATASMNISIGAHPSFPDRENFGRNEMYTDEKDLYRIIYQQIEMVGSLALANGKRMRHVKPHGALYNMAAKDHRFAFIVCSAIHAYDEDLIVYGLSGSEVIRVGDSMGLHTCNEVFADRTYQDDGNLLPRSQPNALVDDSVVALEQVLQMVFHGTAKSASGKTISLNTETICIHSDGKHALSFAKIIHEALKQHGINISHP